MNRDLFCRNYPGYANDMRGLAQGGLTVYKGKHSVAIMSITPTQPGHIILIPEQHTVHRFDLSERTLIDLAETEKEAWIYVQRTFMNEHYFGELQKFYANLRNSSEIVPGSQKKAVRALENMTMSIKPTGYNLGSNLGVSAGQTIAHYHEHLIPRFGQDKGLGVGTGIELVLANEEKIRKEL